MVPPIVVIQGNRRIENLNPKTRFRLLHILFVAVIWFSLYHPLPLEAIGDTVYTELPTEIINDNPDISFTVTGVATEPAPVYSASITPQQFMASWTNTDITQGIIPKTWAINPNNGALGKTANSFLRHDDISPVYGDGRFNFDFRSMTQQQTYDLYGNLLNSNPFPNGCTTMPTMINSIPSGPAEYGGTINDLYGNQYMMCGPNHMFTKLDGNTGATLWAFPLPVLEPAEDSGAGAKYPYFISLVFSADNSVGAFQMYYADGNEYNYNGHTFQAHTGGYIAFNVATGASWGIDVATHRSIRGIYYETYYGTDEDGFPFTWSEPVIPPYPAYKGQLHNAAYTPPSDLTYKFDMKAYGRTSAGLFGMAFRMVNHLNMYRLESSLSGISLVKLNNGAKTILSAQSRPMTPDAWYGYTVKLIAGHIKVYENGGLVIDVTDNDFASGGIGPFSEVENTEFQNVQYQWTSPDTSYNTPGAAIVDTEVIYATTYSDPENDARLDSGTQWKYEQLTTQRTVDLALPAKLQSATQFLDIGDGKSGYAAPAVVAGPLLSFGKVGLYKVDYRVPDNPHSGNPVFAGYSKYANWYTQYLVVHRRPVASFTLAPQPNGVLTWSDSSYDPDRCYAYGNCPGWAASYGISTSGITGEKYYYVEPDGTVVLGKLTNPTQSGSYTIAKAVQDEYKAWSDWYEVTYDVCPGCTAAPNYPPAVLLTFPAGSSASPSLVSLVPTITWNQSDPDPGTIFTVFDLEIKDVYGNCHECVTNRLMNTTDGNWAWTMDSPLQMGQKYQVRARVSDGPSWSPWSNTGWMATNSPPVATLSFPDGTQSAPTIVSSLRPTLMWNQSDPDPATTFDFFQLQITNEANDVMVLDSDKLWQGTGSAIGNWLVTSDLPAGQKLRVRVRVWDQYDSPSNWSDQTWLYINRPPTAIMGFPNGSEAAPNIVTTARPELAWNQADPDPGVVFNFFQIQITNEANHVMILDSGKLWQGTAAPSGSWTVTSDLPAGQKLRVRVKVWDEFNAESDWSTQTWMYINRSPKADFDWIPKPVLEGDSVALANQSTDPDGDSLLYSWQIDGPSYSSVQATQHALMPSTITDHHPGDYRVVLKVTDPYGASDTMVKNVRVGDLRVDGMVGHTAQWEQNRKAYNRLMSGDAERPRPAQMFWSGEAFVLAAETNEPAVQVQAMMSYTELRSQLASANGITWNAQMFRTDFESLPDKEYTFQFTAVWANGHIETAVRTITVSNPWTDFVSSVRKE
jgi:hypothetical protein